MPRHVTIIGGGIAGLAAAYYLQKKSGGDFSYTLLEAGNRLGGKIITERVDEFMIEGGPDSFVTEKPGCLQLCHELGLADQLIPTNELQRKIYVLRNGNLVPFPSGFRLTIPTELKPFLLSPLISPFGKIRMAMEYFLPPRRDVSDESLASFIRRRLGHEALDRIAGPLMAGIFVSDPERLSMQGTFPKFIEMERTFGSLIKAARAARHHPPPPNPLASGNSMFNSLKGGMETLVDALRARLEGEVRLNASVRSIKRSGPRILVALDADKLETDDVILAVPAYQAADLIPSLDHKLSGLLRSIRYVSTTTVSLAYLRADIPARGNLDGFGVLIPASEQRDLIACTWSSLKFKHRAPEGCVLLRAFVGGWRDEAKAQLPDQELLNLVKREFAALFDITSEPLLSRIYRWPRGNPQYDVGHLDRVDEMEAHAAEIPGLYLAGSAYRGIGMPDCIKNAQAAVDKLLDLRV